MTLTAFYPDYNKVAPRFKEPYAMTDGPTALRVADLPQDAPVTFDLRPDAGQMAKIADRLGLSALRKLRFSGTVYATGRADWALKGQIGATVVQPCVVTLAPVTTRIDTDTERLFVADWSEPESADSEMPENDNAEPLGRFIDPAQVMEELLALSVPQYPRAPDAALGEAVFSAPGTEPLREKDLRPFAGLEGLKESLSKKK